MSVDSWTGKQMWCLQTVETCSVAMSCRLFVTLWTAACQATLSFSSVSQSAQIHVHWAVPKNVQRNATQQEKRKKELLAYITTRLNLKTNYTEWKESDTQKAHILYFHVGETGNKAKLICGVRTVIRGCLA